MFSLSKERKILALAWTLFSAVLLFTTPAANAEPFERTSSGWVFATAVDLNVNGRNQNINTTHGKGTFGNSVSNTTTETIFDSLGTSCGELPPAVFAAKLQFTSITTVMRFNSGDLLYATLDISGLLPSHLCVGLSTPGNSSDVNSVIIGGTGKFEGATGWFNTKSKATPLPSATAEASQRAITSIAKGEIFLQDDDEDED